MKQVGKFRKNFSGMYDLLPVSKVYENDALGNLILKTDFERGAYLIKSFILTRVIIYATAQLIKKRICYNNRSQLKEYMRKLLIYYNSEVCNLVIFYLLEKMTNIDTAERTALFDVRIQTRVESYALSNVCSDISNRLSKVQNPNPLNSIFR